MAQLYTDLTDATSLTDDTLAGFDKPAHADIATYGAGTNHPSFAVFRGIIFSGIRYDDKGAACACADIQLLRFADKAYTNCEAHGVQCIGQLRREIPRGGRR